MLYHYAILSLIDGSGQFIVNTDILIDHGHPDCTGIFYGESYLDCDGICNGPNSHDWDADGVCDNVDECIGEYNDFGECLGVEQPIIFYLSQNYPNPFNPITSIDFRLSFNDYISMIIYDLKGNIIRKTIDNKFYNAGRYTKKINSNGLKSGVYFIQLKTTHSIQTRKITVLK